MVVIIRFWGWFGIAAIFWFPIMYVIFLLRCFLRGINKTKQMFKFCKDDLDFVEYAHSKLGIGLWFVWAFFFITESKAIEKGSNEIGIFGIIYVICFVLSFLPFHRIFITKKSKK
jgi:hypothetical protein